MGRITILVESRLLIAGLGLAIACMLSGHVQAGKISCETAGFALEGLTSQYPAAVRKLDANSCVTIHIEGEIVKGDYQAFRSLLSKAEPHVREVSIISPGGDVAEAIKIGEMIRERMLMTKTAFRGDNGIDKLQSDGTYGLVTRCHGYACSCASACFLIWSAGVDRSGNALIVHRPRDSSGSFGAKPAAQASNEYGTLLEHMSNYLVKMEVPSKFIELMLKTPSNASLRLPEAEVQDSLEGFTPNIAEWLIADCGGLTPEEEKRLWSSVVSAKNFDEVESDLMSRYWTTTQCKMRKMIKERSRLAAESPL